MSSGDDAKGTKPVDVNDWIARAARALRSAGNSVAQYTQLAKDRTEIFLGTGRAHLSYGEELAFSYARVAFKWLNQNRELTYGGLAFSALIILPGPRHWLLRQISMSFRSEESMYRSAERRLDRLKANLELYSKEGEKLERRLSAAAEEYDRGLQKLRATNRQLYALSGQMKKEERLAAGLLKDLRYLPSKPALAMRSEVATKLSMLQRHGRQVEGHMYGIARRGV